MLVASNVKKRVEDGPDGPNFCCLLRVSEQLLLILYFSACFPSIFVSFSQILPGQDVKCQLFPSDAGQVSAATH